MDSDEGSDFVKYHSQRQHENYDITLLIENVSQCDILNVGILLSEVFIAHLRRLCRKRCPVYVTSG